MVNEELYLQSRRILFFFMRNKNKILLLWFCLCWLLPSNVAAQSGVHLSLFKEAKKQISIVIPDFLITKTYETQDNTATKGISILKNDLILSGIFDIILTQPIINQLNALDLDDDVIHYSRWKKLGVQALIRGEYSSTKNGITFKLKLFDIINKKYLIGKLYSGRQFHLRQIIHKFADEAVFYLTNERGIAQTKIAFVSKKSGHKELYIIDYDGYNLKQVTNERSLVISPEWSPSGRKLAFTSYKSRNPNLIVVSLESKKEKTIANFPGLNANPSWSPDGKKIAFTSSKDGNPEIYLIDTKRNIRRLTHFSGIDTSPTWSPDGKKIAFTSDRSGTPQIYIMDAKKGDNKMIKRVSFSGRYNDVPAWSPKEDKIAYSSLRNNRFEIVILDLTSVKEVPMAESGYSKESPAWSPNGRFIAFSSTVSGVSAIYIMQSNGTGIRRLTFLKGGGFSPAWSSIPN